MSNKLYRGVRQGVVAKVFVDNAELLFNEANKLHPSTATAEWGYFGDGPSQTALAILYDAIQDLPGAKENALKYMHDFKFEFISNADYNLGFLLMESQIKEWLNKRLQTNTDWGWML